jgi:polar amino acid transport system ATP-binding protein
VKNGAESAVVIEDLHKSYGGVEVLRGVSLSVPRGTASCIIGRSGSGKSTLLRCVNGLTDFQAGRIRVMGIDVGDPACDRLLLCRHVSMVFQQYNLFPHWTALQNVMMAPVKVLRRERKEAEAEAYRLLAKVRLSGKELHYPGELSGGQQQRVAIARSLAMHPEVILFDEVTAALDPEMVGEVLQTIGELLAEGMTSLLVTHEMGFARAVADEVYFMDQGIIVEHAPPKSLFESPREERTQQFLGQVLRHGEPA